jgi:hypothetical protein
VLEREGAAMIWVIIVLLVIIAFLGAALGYGAGLNERLTKENELLNQKVIALEKALDEEDDAVFREMALERKNNLTEK